jgi:putative restriction endonuclease
MAILRKKSDLLARFEDAVRLSGWNLLYLSKDTQPARYRVFRDEESFLVRVFIWNITPGGKSRPKDEYRIQNTGLKAIHSETGARNLILGWWEDVGVFAGWDIRQHIGAVSSSPSMQVKEGTLRQALLTGFAPYINQRGETAIAFRPDFMGAYIAFLEPLHDSGKVPEEAAILTKLSEDPDEVADKDIYDEVAEKRKFAVLSTKRALRALDFGRRVLGAYGHQCAMCGMQLRLIHGAHILPAAHEDSTDQTSNGVALCALHHRAYDRALVTFDPLFKVNVNEQMVNKLKTDDRAAGLASFCKYLRPLLIVPPDKKDRPAEKFVKAANVLRGWP